MEKTSKGATETTEGSEFLWATPFPAPPPRRPQGRQALFTPAGYELGKSQAAPGQGKLKHQARSGAVAAGTLGWLR